MKARDGKLAAARERPHDGSKLRFSRRKMHFLTDDSIIACHLATQRLAQHGAYCFSYILLLFLLQRALKEASNKPYVDPDL